MLRTYLIYRNLGLVYHIANSYSNKMELEELYQEGIIGLTKAIECFDPFRGIRFSSYGCQWIKQAISRYISTKNTQIRIPAYLSSCYYTICNSDISDWEYTDIKIIAAKYDISENTAKFLIKVRNIESLDYAIEGESSVILTDFLFTKMNTGQVLHTMMMAMWSPVQMKEKRKQPLVMIRIITLRRSRHQQGLSLSILMMTSIALQVL